MPWKPAGQPAVGVRLQRDRPARPGPPCCLQPARVWRRHIRPSLSHTARSHSKSHPSAAPSVDRPQPPAKPPAICSPSVGRPPRPDHCISAAAAAVTPPKPDDSSHHAPPNRLPGQLMRRNGGKSRNGSLSPSLSRCVCASDSCYPLPSPRKLGRAGVGNALAASEWWRLPLRVVQMTCLANR